MRIALVTEIPAPFRVPLWNALADRDGVQLEVLFLARNDPRRAYDLDERQFRFAWRVLPGRGLQARGRWLLINRGVGTALRDARPDVVLAGGWNQPAFWSALLHARRGAVPLVVWVESTARDLRSAARLTASPKRAFVRAAAGFVVPGTAAAEYLRSLGAPADRIAVAPNAFDAAAFAARVDRARGARQRGERPMLLCVSRFSHEKGVDLAVRAVDGVSAELALVGYGPDEALLRRLASDRVRFLGRKTPDELPSAYALADAFVLPSRSETWGMALSEAAAAALPLVASDAVGGAYELIEEGVNGYRVPVDDVDALRAVLHRVAGDEHWRQRAGRRSRELVAGHTPEAWAEAVARLARRLAH